MSTAMPFSTRQDRAPSQAAAVPFRIRGRVLEVALITTSRGGRWSIPKGNIERGERARESALREALEEAGLVGDLVGPRLGSFRYEKRGRARSVAVYLLRVTRELRRLLGSLSERVPA